MKMRGFLRLALLAAVTSAGARLAAADSETWVKAYSLDDVSRVTVANVNGEVVVRAWERNYVRVTAVKTGRPSAISRTTIRATQKGNTIHIETVGPREHRHFFSLFFGGNRLARVDYEVLAPSSTGIGIENVNGGVAVHDRSGEVHFSTVNGRAEIAGVSGSVRGETVNGRIELKAADCSRDVSLETVNGPIEASFPKGCSLHYRMETVNGHLDAAGRQYQGHSFGGKEMSGDLNGGRSSFRAETVNGSITLNIEGAESSPEPAHPSGDEKSEDN